MYPLIVKNRLLRSREQPINLGPVRDVPEWATTISGWDEFDLELRRGGNAWLTLNYPVKTPMLLMTEELAADAAAQGVETNVTLDLTVLLMTSGNTQSRYGGGSYFDPLDTEALHLLTCGVDWERFRAPGAERWQESNDTFDEGDRYQDVLATTLYCRCEQDSTKNPGRWLYGVSFGFEMPSIADLILALSSDDLGRLFRSEY